MISWKNHQALVVQRIQVCFLFHSELMSQKRFHPIGFWTLEPQSIWPCHLNNSPILHNLKSLHNKSQQRDHERVQTLRWQQVRTHHHHFTLLRIRFDPFAFGLTPLQQNQSLFLTPKALNLHPSLPRHLLHHSLSFFLRHWPWTSQVFLLYFAVHVSFPAGSSNSRLRSLPFMR